MSKIDLKNLTIQKAHDSLVKGDFSAVQLTQAYLDNISAKNGDIHAYLEVFDDAIEQAKAADATIADLQKNGHPDEVPMLCGIPCAIKDNILIKGHIASAAPKMLEDYRATYDATVIAKLKKEGVVFLG